jgi:hypothetical protein
LERHPSDNSNAETQDAIEVGQVPASSGSTVLFVPKAEQTFKDFDVSALESFALPGPRAVGEGQATHSRLGSTTDPAAHVQVFDFDSPLFGGDFLEVSGEDWASAPHSPSDGEPALLLLMEQHRSVAA